MFKNKDSNSNVWVYHCFLGITLGQVTSLLSETKVCHINGFQMFWPDPQEDIDLHHDPRTKEVYG